MGRLADGRVVHVKIVTDGPHDDLSRVEADSNLKRRVAVLRRAPIKRSDRVLHPQGCIACADRVVFVRERRTKQRHDAVTEHLVHSALEVVNGLHHPSQNGVEEIASFLGIAVGQQLHGGTDVGKQHRDLLALSFERPPGRQNSCRKMSRRIDLR